MARAYCAVGQQTVASPTDTCLTVQSTTAIRPYLYDMIFSVSSTPADVALQWQIQAFDTDDGTGTAVTPTPLYNGNPAASCTVQDNHTTEPSSYIAGEILLDLAMNTRSTQRWVASPGRGFTLPAIATEGVGFLPIHASSTPEAQVCLYFEE